MIRKLFVIAGGVGGVFGSRELLVRFIESRNGDVSGLNSSEALPILIPLGLMGFLAGALLAAMLLPSRRQ